MTADAREARLLCAWLGVVALVYTLAYLGHPALPGNDPQAPLGWWGWWDQGQYIKSAHGLSQLVLDRTTWWYPLGYPAMGAAFARFAPNHAFFVADLLLALASAWLCFAMARRYMSAMEAVLLGAIFIFFHRWLLTASNVVPWNTLPMQVVNLAGIHLLLSRPPARAATLMSLLVAASVWIRPLDTLVMAPMLAAAIWTSGEWKQRLRLGATCAAIVAVSWLAEAALKMKVWGTLMTPYDEAAWRVGFFAWPAAAQLYWLLIDGRDFFLAKEVGLLFAYPWLVLAPAALAFVVAREGLRGAAIAIGVVVGFLTYARFNDFVPWNLFTYLLMHYVAWMFPLLFILAYATLRAGLRWLGVAAASAAVIALAALMLTYEPGEPRRIPTADGRAALPPERPLLVEFEHRGADPRKLEVRNEQRALDRIPEYLAVAGPRNMRVLLSSKARGETFGFRIGEAPVPAEIHAAGYRWSLGFDATRLGGLFPRLRRLHLEAPARSSEDVSGPTGQPDGEKDIEVVLRGPEAILSRVAAWELHLAGGGGAWASVPTPQNWWILVPRKTGEGQRTFYFKDNGLPLKAKGFVLIGYDAQGRETLRERHGQ